MERPAVTHAATPDPLEHVSGHLLGVAGRKRVKHVFCWPVPFSVFENFLRQGSNNKTGTK